MQCCEESAVNDPCDAQRTSVIPVVVKTTTIERITCVKRIAQKWSSVKWSRQNVRQRRKLSCFVDIVNVSCVEKSRLRSSTSDSSCAPRLQGKDSWESWLHVLTQVRQHGRNKLSEVEDSWARLCKVIQVSDNCQTRIRKFKGWPKLKYYKTSLFVVFLPVVVCHQTKNCTSTRKKETVKK